MPEITWGGAALAGLLSFLSPCILPMVPFYLSYMAGSSVAELRGEGANLTPKLRARLIGRALCFALGVTTIDLARGEDGIGRYLSLTQSTLRLIAERRPHTMAQLEGIPGMDAQKAERFGPAFLSLIAAE